MARVESEQINYHTVYYTEEERGRAVGAQKKLFAEGYELVKQKAPTPGVEGWRKYKLVHHYDREI